MPGLHQIPLADLNGLDLLPLAQLGRAPEYFARIHGLHFSRDNDDLDYYDIAALRLHNLLPALRHGVLAGPLLFALRAYRAAPPETVDVLLPARWRGKNWLPQAVTAITADLGLQPGDIVWPVIPRAAEAEPARHDQYASGPIRYTMH